MSFEILSFRNADKIIKEKKMNRELKEVMEYLNDCLYGTRHKSELLRQALQENDWRKNGDLNVLDGRRYFYKGFKNRVALDGSFSSYEYIQNALLKLQVGFDHKKIDMGIVLITSQRSEKSKLGTTKKLVYQEIEMLEPTINLPVTIVLFDLGRPGELYAEKKEDALPKKGLKIKSVPENKVYSNAEEQAFHDVQKNKKKSRLKSKKAALQEQQEAA
jgi:hypothetical protein